MKYILFDLDGTLLPMDQEKFTKAYFNYLSTVLLEYGYDKKKLVDGIWQATSSMIQNDGTKTNEEAFWQTFSDILGNRVYNDKPIFDKFYQTTFNELKNVCGYDENVKYVIDEIKKLGYKMVVATNPIFPSVAQENRMHWARLDINDFNFYTSYENMNYCKPNPKYYQSIIEKLGCEAQDCLMVGNDVNEDMVASKIGMKVFLLTNNLINKNNVDISTYPQGNFLDVLDYINKL